MTLCNTPLWLQLPLCHIRFFSLLLPHLEALETKQQHQHYHRQIPPHVYRHLMNIIYQWINFSIDLRRRQRQQNEVFRHREIFTMKRRKSVRLVLHPWTTFLQQVKWKLWQKVKWNETKRLTFVFSIVFRKSWRSLILNDIDGIQWNCLSRCSLSKWKSWLKCEVIFFLIHS